MHSKLLPWDLFLTNNLEKALNERQFLAFMTDDLIVERMIKDRVKAKSQSSLRLLYGNEITREFLENEFLNLSFFTDQNPLLILSAELISIDLLTYFLSSELNLENAYIYLFFSKTNKKSHDLLKASSCMFFEIERPKFWEGPKMLSFLLEGEKVHFSQGVKAFILENFEHTFESFVRALNLIQSHFEEEELSRLTISQLESLIEKEHYDFFELIERYHGKRAEYFILLREKSSDFDWMINHVISMQNHLLKVLNFDEKSLNGKKLNKYEQNLKKWSMLNLSELYREDLRFFMKLDSSAKLKNIFLGDQISLYYSKN